MIINIRGTSGSGKSTLARRVMELYPSRSAIRLKQGRKQPIGYMLTKPAVASLYVIGHYETACGGCDTITNADDTFDYVRRGDTSSCNVLYEGLLLSADVRRVLELKAEGRDVHVIELDVPIDVCLASVNERRRAKDPEKPDVNPKNTTSKHRAVQLSRRRLEEAGVPYYALDRDAAFAKIKELLGHE